MSSSEFRNLVGELHEIELNPYHTYSELKEFVGKLNEDEWYRLVRQLPKNPRLGNLGNLRRQYLKEHEKTA